VVLLKGNGVYLNKGETVNILEESGDFYYVSLKFNGKTVKGYVHKDFIKVSADSDTPKPTATPKPTSKPTVTPKPTSAPQAGESVAITKKVELKASVIATTLNVRSGPSTAYSKVAGLVKGASVTVLNEVMAEDNTWWYGISFKQNTETLKGYVSSDFIQLSYSSSVKAEIYTAKLKISTKAGSNATYVKYRDGTAITLKKGKNVTIIGETTVSNTKWFKISFTVDSIKYTGYAEADKINLRSTVTATATPTPKPTAKPTATPKPTAKPQNRETQFIFGNKEESQTIW
jgi:uncharacterized protein YraI